MTFIYMCVVSAIYLCVGLAIIVTMPSGLHKDMALVGSQMAYLFLLTVWLFVLIVQRRRKHG